MNIAEILKYCPEGTKLYSLIDGEVTLKSVNIAEQYPIETVKDDFRNNYYTKDGLFFSGCPNGECLLFPSKDQRDWNKFRLPANDGDIMMLPKEEKAFIFKKYIERVEGSGVLHADHYCGINQDNDFIVKVKDFYWTRDFIVPASEKAKKELFDRITKEGYKWDNKKLKLEKIQIKCPFQVGDVIEDKYENFYLVTRFDSQNNVVAYDTKFNIEITFCWEQIKITSPARKMEYYKYLAKNGFVFDGIALVKYSFKPFDKVLMRDKGKEWRAKFFSKIIYLVSSKSFVFQSIEDSIFEECIPYEGNEHLFETNDDCIKEQC